MRGCRCARRWALAGTWPTRRCSWPPTRPTSSPAFRCWSTAAAACAGSDDARSDAMAAANYLPDVLETTTPERLATGFIFTEGPLWHPDGFWYFVDIRQNKLLRMTPGQAPEVV